MTRALRGRALRILIGLIALIEAIFLAESFTTLMETVVRNGGSVFDAAFLLALKTPEVMDFALPLALLIGLYFAITSAREDNELIACAAAGVPWTRIPRVALVFGLVGFCISILFSGFLTPLAHYTQRLAVHAMESQRAAEEITDSGPKNTTRTIEGRTFIATPSEDNASERGNLFIFEPDLGDGWRVSQADDWTVVGPQVDGTYAIRLESYRDYTGRSSAQGKAREENLSHLQSTLQDAEVNVSTLALRFRLEEMFDPADRTPRHNEQTLIRTGSHVAAGIVVDQLPLVDKRLGEILARAILCLFAAMLAVAAAAFATTKLGRFTALPGGAILVLGIDVFSRTFLAQAGIVGGVEFWISAAALFVGALLLPWTYIAFRRETMIAPGRGRS